MKKLLINGKPISECDLNQLIIKQDVGKYDRLIAESKGWKATIEPSDTLTLYDCQCYMKRKNRLYFKDNDGTKFIIEFK